MNLSFILATIFAAASFRPEKFACSASGAEAEAVNDIRSDVGGDVGRDKEDDDEFYDLENMSDEELEEICTSRGFELVREVDVDTGEPIVYTHRDFVDAAGECLRIEADVEEILQKHPEILEDVQKESERMMKERDRLLAEFHQQNQQGAYDATEPQGKSTERNEGGEVSSDSAVEDGGVGAPSERNKGIRNQTGNNLNYDDKEIMLEVIQQMKSDFTKVLNFILPEKLREKIKLQIKKQIQPAVKSFVLVSKDMGRTAYDVARRYIAAFVGNMSAGGDRYASDGKTASEKENASTLKEEQVTAA
mmetsp:Transcript_48123/g.102384  ORF Transcript_48123/g.102384 Transcript_48123/m.102384 type:complete len:305 (-) Transcript_48123:192-1106(-)|eukprot:CAMPEP_0172540098 /NCGR_PEP_ID=MMETSP1067-20121228/11168_1 /TAXON_ID=265564 ORGANISM="Thalassiosira punctigera, Strain Tpunct2005C2" /NCGR_SAMPLE_ID=MMETSP1067 /ASSEMBLY_ACC=CAM_ASM_000444 /LENGTH=304 /DNA_ID=CAMNT_0013325881 /DNA_START=108 /DNA_END=1022 /DNA_ORIENTATION=-